MRTPQATVKSAGLDIGVIDFERAAIYQPGDQIIDVNLRLTNPAASNGTGQLAPDMELRDGKGRTYGLIRDYRLMQPVPAGESVNATQHFIVARDATSLTLVIAPGSNDEVAVRLIRSR